MKLTEAYGRWLKLLEFCGWSYLSEKGRARFKMAGWFVIGVAVGWIA